MGIFAAVANLWFFGLMLLVEYQLGRSGLIPRRNSRHDPARPQESFLYLMDRDMFRIGDVVGLTITAFAVGEILRRTGFPPMWYVIVALAVGVVLTAKMHTVWVKQAKRDSAYPPGGTSLLGWVHLPYFGGHVVWILLGLGHALDIRVLGFVLLGFFGGGIWIWASVRDKKQKKFL
jgi:hypothetical protein